MYFIIQISEYMLLSHIMHFVNFWWVILLNNVILTWLMKTVDQNAWTIKIIGHYDCWTRNQRFWVKPRFFFLHFLINLLLYALICWCQLQRQKLECKKPKFLCLPCPCASLLKLRTWKCPKSVFLLPLPICHSDSLLNPSLE